MGAYIVIKDGDVLEGFKEYYLNSLISLAIWKGNYPDLWADAGGQTLSLNGKEYFGGTVRLDSINTDAKLELCEKTGIDEEGIEEIREAQANGDVNHVDMIFRPRQTFTLDGLRYFLNNKVKQTLIDESVTEFETYSYSEWSTTQQSEPYTSSFPSKIPASTTSFEKFIHNPTSLENNTNYLLYGSTAVSSSDDVNESLELLYRLTSWFEDHETITTEVTEESQDDGYGTTEYRYLTTITISLSDLSYLTTNELTEALFDEIHLGDTVDSYSYEDAESGTIGWMKFALLLWNLEFPLQHNYSGWQSSVSSLEGNDTVIYHDGKYWIDTTVWKTSLPIHCMLTLGRLIDIDIVEDKGGFWNSFVGKLLRFIIEIVNIVVKVLGELVYSVLWIAGLWVLDVMQNMDLIKKTSLDKFKKVFKRVAGTIALLVLTGGISAEIQAAELAAAQATALEVGTVEAYAAVAEITTAMAAELTTLEIIEMLSEVVMAGIDEYKQFELDTAANAEIAAQIEDTKDPLEFVYESDDEPIDIAEYFIDSVYEMLDPYADMDM